MMPDALRSGRRPRIDGEVSSEVFKIRLTPSERRHLQEVARQNQTTMTDVLREAVNEYVADYGERLVFVAAAQVAEFAPGRPDDPTLAWPSNTPAAPSCRGNALQRPRCRSLESER